MTKSARAHAPLLAILALGAVLVLTHLGRDHLWADEGDTAVLAKSILKFGVPQAWDGASFIDADYGARLNDDLIMVSHPWLQYYLTAASFALFGESAWAARLPFALLGLATIALAYRLVLRATGNRWTAATAAWLLLLSVQFLVYARQSRYYTLSAALSCLLVLQFTRLTSWSAGLIFAGIAILLFHSHPIALAPLAALAVLTALPSFRGQRRWFWRSAPVIAVFTLPWLVVARGGYAENTGLLTDASVFLPRLLQFVIECGSVTSIVGAAVLFVILRRRHLRTAIRSQERRPAPPRDLFPIRERTLLVILIAILAAYGIAMAVTQPRDTIWSAGMRYTPAVIPFMAIILAVLIASVSRTNWRVWSALVLVLGFTKLGRLTPWTFWAEPRVTRDPRAEVTFHNPPRVVDRVLRTGQLAFLESLERPSMGTMARITSYLTEHAAPRDIVVTNYEWEPLYFHTGLRLGMTLLPTYPVYGPAKGRGLPDYVFRGDDARWIVWRRAWGAYRGQRIDQLLARLEADRVPVTLVARMPETMWENRENVHYRRFPDDRYLYSWYRDIPEVWIYRVDRPSGAGTGPR